MQFHYHIPAIVVVVCLRTVCPARRGEGWETVQTPSFPSYKPSAPPAAPSPHCGSWWGPAGWRITPPWGTWTPDITTSEQSILGRDQIIVLKLSRWNTSSQLSHLPPPSSTLMLPADPLALYNFTDRARGRDCKLYNITLYVPQHTTYTNLTQYGR